MSQVKPEAASSQNVEKGRKKKSRNTLAHIDGEEVLAMRKLRHKSRTKSIHTLAQKSWGRRVLENKWFSATMTAWTVFALFGDDFRLLTTFSPADVPFSILAIIAMVLFAFELVLNSVERPEWRFGFYFWLDFAATVSVLPDIMWFNELLEGGGSAEGQETLELGRTSRASTKAGRFVRVVRLVRMVRMVKLYKMHGGGDDDDLQAARMAEQEPSQVGKILSEKITRKVIILVLVMLGVLPLFDGFGDSTNQYQDFGLQGLHRLSQEFNCQGGEAPLSVPKSTLKEAVQSYARTAGRLMHLKLPGLQSNETEEWIRDVKFLERGTLEAFASAEEGSRIAINFAADTLFDDEAGIQSSFTPSLEVTNRTAIDAKYRKGTDYDLIEYIGCYHTCLSDPTSSYWGGIIDADQDASDCVSSAIFLLRPDTQLQSFLNILKTIFVMLVLVFGAVMFSNDAEKLVIGPIERMIDTVQLLADNPLANTQSGTKGGEWALVNTEKDVKSGYETALLEKTLAKVSSLMQVGFGAAGAEIIGSNMQNDNGTINPMTDGTLITSVFGFCDIRKFTDTTECLQEEVMTYVNKLGELVHGCTHAYYGMANKNVGDAFLLTWKVCDGLLPGFHDFEETQHGGRFYEFDEVQRLRANDAWNKAREKQEELAQHVKKMREEGVEKDIIEEAKRVLNADPRPGKIKPARPSKGKGRRSRFVSPTEMADSAFTAFLKACVDLHNANIDGNLAMYLKHPRVLKRFGEGFTIKMGFGMHVGWCVQGAIGSSYKIDCTYLSPHCEMADRLEAGSKIFETPMNLSHYLVALMSPTIKRHLRAIDRIKVSGVPVPLTVYTFDIFSYRNPDGSAREVFEPKMRNNTQYRCDFLDDTNYADLQTGMHPNFLAKFREGYAHYIDGNWDQARVVFEEVLEMPSANQYFDKKTGKRKPDGPTMQLMRYMSEHEFVAGKSWNGVHVMEGY